MRSLVNPNDRIEVSGNVKEAVDRFCNEVSNEPVDTSRMGIRRSKEKAIELLRTIYGISDTCLKITGVFTEDLEQA